MDRAQQWEITHIGYRSLANNRINGTLPEWPNLKQLRAMLVTSNPTWRETSHFSPQTRNHTHWWFDRSLYNNTISGTLANWLDLKRLYSMWVLFHAVETAPSGKSSSSGTQVPLHLMMAITCDTTSSLLSQTWVITNRLGRLLSNNQINGSLPEWSNLSLFILFVTLEPFHSLKWS